MMKENKTMMNEEMRELAESIKKNLQKVYKTDEDFDAIWKQLETDKEKWQFKANLCYRKISGKIDIYFHVLCVNDFKSYRMDRYYNIPLNKWREICKEWNEISNGKDIDNIFIYWMGY